MRRRMTVLEDARMTAKTGCHGGKRDDLGGQYFRSAWEANYARYLNWLVAHGDIRSWSYEPREFTFPVKRGNTTYLPDFEIVENDGLTSYHEVKGYMDADSRTKLKRMAKYHPGVKIVLVDRDAYQAIARMRALIPGWE